MKIKKVMTFMCLLLHCIMMLHVAVVHSYHSHEWQQEVMAHSSSEFAHNHSECNSPQNNASCQHARYYTAGVNKTNIPCSAVCHQNIFTELIPHIAAAVDIKSKHLIKNLPAHYAANIPFRAPPAACL